MNRTIFGKGKQTVGKTPAVALINPKYSRNVSQVVRACSCFGIEQCWFTGDRVQMELASKTRMPREERMKGYSKVNIIQFDYFFEQFPDFTPIGIEVMEGAEMLTTFDHPENALYVFGPEDGGLTKIARGFCHRFVFIPMQHCANLAASVYITLYDRYLKRARRGLEKPMTITEVLDEPRGWHQFEEQYYGNSENSFKEISVDKMLMTGVDKKV
jgi:tRNA(Leu) C34 or U34 (ribose-2'-O)-methylase TrmL